MCHPTQPNSTAAAPEQKGPYTYILTPVTPCPTCGCCPTCGRCAPNPIGPFDPYIQLPVTVYTSRKIGPFTVTFVGGMAQ